MESIQTQLNLYGLVFPNKETELNKLEKRVFNLLPLGKEHAVSCIYIADTLNVSSRTVIETVRRLRLKKYDIGSTKNNGYYLFKDPQEYLEFMARYSKETTRRKQVIEAMRCTPMARKITAETNQATRQKTPRKE